MRRVRLPCSPSWQAVSLPGQRTPLPPDCPNGGAMHFGAIPAEDMAQLLPIFQRIGGLIAARLDCNVVVRTGTSYTAVIEAMRAHRVDVASFGAFSYVLAHQVAGARSGGRLCRAGRQAGQLLRHHHDVARLRHHHAAAGEGACVCLLRSGVHLGPSIPSYALVKAGIDPDKDITPFYTGSHTASFEALRNHKVPVGELNSTAISGATQAGILQAAGLRHPLEIAADSERSVRRARRPAGGVQGAADACAADPGSEQQPAQRHEVPGPEGQPRTRRGE